MWRLGNYELAEHTVSRPGPLTRRLRKRGRARVSEPPTDSSPRSSAGKQSGCRTSRNAGGSATGARLQAVQSGKWKMRPGARLAVASPRLRHAPGCIPKVRQPWRLGLERPPAACLRAAAVRAANQQETRFCRLPFWGTWRLAAPGSGPSLAAEGDSDCGETRIPNGSAGARQADFGAARSTSGNPVARSRAAAHHRSPSCLRLTPRSPKARARRCRDRCLGSRLRG
jgi:hypothetical protein